METTILLVDDEPSIIKALQRLMQDSDWRLLTAENGAQALSILEKNAVDLVLSDYKMPGMNGADLLSKIRTIDPDIVRIMISSFSDREIMSDAINRGEVYRFVFKPWEDESLLEIISQGLERRRSLARDRINVQRQLNRVSLETVMALAEAIELKDPYTKGHCSRVRDYAILIARECGLPDNDIYPLIYGSLLHDCGKIGVSESVLLHNGALDVTQRHVMERHAVLGFEITSRIDSLKTASLFIRQHHERWDGNGYPDGLKGEEIHLCSRMIGIADAFDAMTSDRPYRKGMAKEKALTILENNAGSQFDPELVGVFKQVMHNREPGDIQLGESVEVSGRPPQILLVDDERSVIRAISRSLFDENYDIHAATDGEEGLRIMKEEEIDLIISDQRMPAMTGVEFLKQARSICPSAIRIMLSGYADLNAALEAINEAGIYKFLVKPWDDRELKKTIEKALEWRQMVAGSYTLGQ